MTQSAEDLDVTFRLAEVRRLLGVMLLGHEFRHAVRVGADDRDEDIIPLFSPAEQSCRLGAARQGAIHHGEGVFEELHVVVEVDAARSLRRRAGCGRRAG